MLITELYFKATRADSDGSVSMEIKHPAKAEVSKMELWSINFSTLIPGRF
jgi:hypothetical protein